MCVIIIKPAGIKAPSEDVLQDCYMANPDLCGVSIAHNKIVCTHRGINIDTLLSINVQDNDIAIYHFRIATSGVVNITNAHPFPLPGNFSKQYTESFAAFAHNGIVRGVGDKILSDTTTLAQQFQSTPIKDIRFWLRTLAYNSTNRFALLTPNKVYKYGDFIERDGLLFSNLFWVYKSQAYNYQYDSDVWYTMPPMTATSGENSKYISPYGNCRYCGVSLLKHESMDHVCDDCYSTKIHKFSHYTPKG